MQSNNPNDHGKTSPPKLTSYLRDEVFYDSGVDRRIKNNSNNTTNKKVKSADSAFSNIEGQIVELRSSSEKQIQLLIDQQKQQNIIETIHNKTVELDLIDQNLEKNMDIIEDNTQSEQKRTRAQEKVEELNIRASFIKKWIRENDPENPLGFEKHIDNDASDCVTNK